MREVGEMGGGGQGHFIGAEKEGDRAFMAVFKARRRIAAVMDGDGIWGRNEGRWSGVLSVVTLTSGVGLSARRGA